MERGSHIGRHACLFVYDIESVQKRTMEIERERERDGHIYRIQRGRREGSILMKILAVWMCIVYRVRAEGKEASISVEILPSSKEF